jgi:hypothetical protein
MDALRQPAGLGATTGLGTHLDVGVQRRHVIAELVWGLGYDVSEKHSEKNLHVT